MPDVVKILWVDDEKGAVADTAKLLKISLPGITLDFKIIDKVGDVTTSEIEDQDIILIDFNLGEDKNGLELIKLIAESDFVAETVLYSEKEDVTSNSIVTQALAYYSKVQCVTTREKLKEILPPLIRERALLREDPVWLRGTVICESIELEQDLDSLLTEYYFKGQTGAKQDEFRSHILESKYISMGNKHNFLTSVITQFEQELSRLVSVSEKSILEELIRELKDLKNGVEKISEERNKFAHYRLNKDNELYCGTGTPLKLERSKIISLMVKIKHQKTLIAILRKKFKESRT